MVFKVRRRKSEKKACRGQDGTVKRGMRKLEVKVGGKDEKIRWFSRPREVRARKRHV